VPPLLPLALAPRLKDEGVRGGIALELLLLGVDRGRGLGGGGLVGLAVTAGRGLLVQSVGVLHIADSPVYVCSACTRCIAA
jgi:hypothetical protein